MPNCGRDGVIVVGLGKTGMSCVRFFMEKGVVPGVMDECRSPLFLNRLPPEVPLHLGSLNRNWLLEATLVVVSPGVPLDHPVLNSADVRKKIVGDVELFAREVRSEVVAITGSNGKSTVSEMLKMAARSCGWTAEVGGNSDLPALLLLGKRLQLCVLELSSFQLESISSLRTLASTVLNISQDHLDRYRSMHHYRAAKFKIYRHAKIRLVNVRHRSALTSHPGHVRCVSFGVRSGDYHLETKGRKTYIVAHGERVFSCDEMRTRGMHSYVNAMVVFALSDILGLRRTASANVLVNFNGLRHRCMLVHERMGVRWIDDSKSTNPGSTRAALAAVKTAGRLHLLLGGDGKGADFTILRSCVRRREVQIYCFGKDGERIARELGNHPAGVVVAESLEQAVRVVVRRVSREDVVLLSPACSSRDQFANFGERGRLFASLAREMW